MSTLQTAHDRIRLWRDHPAQFVRDVFKAEPEGWQVEVLEAFPTHPAQAMLCCKGPGKTAVLAWLIWNFLSCYTHAKIAATSVSARNLRDNLWAELAKWRSRSPFLMEAFEWTSERVFAKEAPATWWCSARTWPQNADPQAQADTLAGLWADNVMVAMDEAGAIPPAVLATAEVILANAAAKAAGSPTRSAHVVLAGNANSHTSALYKAAIEHRSHWHVTEVSADPDDPKRTSRIPKEFAQQQIDQYGRDNPWVRINILGQFPKQGLNTLLSPDDVIAAQHRHYVEATFAGFPKIIGVDVALFGDDETVFFKRQGKIAYAPLRMRNLSPLQGGPHLMRVAEEWEADSIQIDISGGFGAAWQEFLTTSGVSWSRGVQFGGAASVGARFKNMRAEMYWKLAEWIKEGGALPRTAELVEELPTMQYSYDPKGLLLIESKEQIKARLGHSPDCSDALACTFAYPVVPRRASLPGTSGVIEALQHNLHVHEYNPIERFNAECEAEERRRYGN